MADIWLRPVNGDDSNSGATYASAYKTMSKVWYNYNQGDTIYLCAEANYKVIDEPYTGVAPYDKFGYDSGTGTYYPIVFSRWPDAGASDTINQSYNPQYSTRMVGVNSSGIDDGTQFVFDGTGWGTGEQMFYIGSKDSGGQNFRVENIRFTKSPKDGGIFEYYTDGNSGQFYFYNCTFDNNARSGFAMNGYDVDSANLKFTKCKFHHNGEDGLSGSSSGGRSSLWANYCSFYHNDHSGISDYSINGSNYNHCLIYKNASYGILGADYTGLKVCNSTICYNTMGMVIDYFHPTFLYNNIIAFNDNYGLYAWSSAGYGRYFLNLNKICVYGNGIEEIRLEAPNYLLEGENIIREDPDFISTVDGSENLTPQNENLDIGYAFHSGGTSYDYIGAIKPVRIR